MAVCNITTKVPTPNETLLTIFDEFDGKGTVFFSKSDLGCCGSEGDWVVLRIGIIALHGNSVLVVSKGSLENLMS